MSDLNKLTLPNGKIITFNDEQYSGIIKILNWLKSDKNIFTLSGYAGTGKSQPVGILINTPEGIKRFGDLNVGDFVFGLTGKPVLVNGVYPQGVLDTYLIGFSDNTFTYCNDEHLWEVYDHQTDKSYVKTLSEILRDGITYRKLFRTCFKYSIPVCNSVEYAYVDLPISSYMFGRLLSEGSFIDYSYKEFDYSSSDLGCYGDKWNKFIPEKYKYSSIEQRWELLKGLMDGYGYIKKRRTFFKSSSNTLINDVTDLVRSLGGIVILSENDDSVVEIKLSKNPFKLCKYHSKWSILDNKPIKYITSIVKDVKTEQMCISVDAADGLYLTNDYIVTHNTTVIKKILDNYRYGVVVSAPTHKAKKVIMNTTGKSGQTLHSLLGLRPDLDLDDFNPNDPKFNPIAIPRINDYNLCIIDESSMINTELLSLINDKINSKYSKTKVLFMGDPAQIPPVGEKISAVFTDVDDETFHQFTKVERQNDGNPLSITYDSLRNNLEDVDGGIIRKTNLNSLNEGIIFTINKKQFRTAIMDKYSSSEFKLDTDYAKLIAWKNDTVMQSNKVIRSELFENTQDVIVVGDMLMGYRSITNESQTHNIIENSADYRVVDRSSIEENSYGIRGYRVKLREDLSKGVFKFEDVFIVDINDHNNLHLYGDMHDFFKDMGKSNKKMWRKYYEFRRHNILMKTIDKYRNGLYRSSENIIVKDMDYGYCLTAHKSQGSTYTHAFVMENDINQNWLIKERNQIKYVALTRPTTTATVLTTKLDD